MAILGLDASLDVTSEQYEQDTARPVTARPVTARPMVAVPTRAGVVIDLSTQRPVVVAGDRIIPVSDGAVSRRQRVVTRSFDLLLAIPATLLLLPVMLAVALAVVFTSRGPALYASTRYSRDGRAFQMWKFRSMVIHGDEILEQHLSEHPEEADFWSRHHKLKTDPRVTKVGAFIRKWSLDELPQLFNVVRGQMSVVGPRPLLDFEKEKFGSALAVVGQVKGGLTGRWQVSGRSELTFDERIMHDVLYVTERSLWKDICIVVRTARQLALGRPGAY